MSRIDELIKKHCPNGVEFVSLGKSCDIEDNKRKPIKASERIKGETPYYGANNIQDYVEGYTHDGEYVLIAEDGSSSLENYSIQYVVGQFWANNHVHVVKGKEGLNSRFLYHYLTAFNFVPFLVGGTRAKLNKEEMLKIRIPFPPLTVQREIVEVLDNFTELTAELTARKKQYEYYRDKLLSFSKNTERVKWRFLGEIAQGTSNMRWKETNNTYRYIDLTSVSRDNHNIVDTIEISANNAPSRAQKIVQKGDVIFATTRPTLQRYTLIDDDYDGQIASTGYCVLRAKVEDVLPKWIYYNIGKTDFNDYVEKNQEGSAYPAISDAKVKAYAIPVPALDEQARIVSILDHFDALCTDITAGLPAEIACRRKQYEYYRDKLLSFNAMGAGLKPAPTSTSAPMSVVLRDTTGDGKRHDAI